MKITNVNLGNFKRFKDLKINTNADITLLLGENSSGKSSIIKSILGLKQTVHPSNESENLATQGDYVDLGSYSEFAYKHDPKNKVRIGISLETGINSSFSLRSSHQRHPVSKIDYSITYDYNPITEQPRIHSFEITTHFSDFKIPLAIKIERKKTRDTYNLTIPPEFFTQPKFELRKDHRNKVKNWKKGISVEHSQRISFRRIPKKNTEPDFDLAIIWMHTLQSQLEQSLLNHIFYIGPIRSHPSRNYIRTSHAQAVGPKGEYTASVLANLEKRQKKVTTGSSPLQTQYTFLKTALNILFPGKNFTPHTIQELVRLEFFNSENADKKKPSRGESIMDIGFGFSQIFPILVQLAVMPRGATLIVEQPELHLHPLAQTRLAKVFALAVKDDKRIIAETHSDHMIRGIQLELSESRRSNSSEQLQKDQIKLYYTKTSSDSPIELPLSDWGEFTQSWPPGFMDVGYSTTMQILTNKANS